MNHAGPETFHPARTEMPKGNPERHTTDREAW